MTKTIERLSLLAQGLAPSQQQVLLEIAENLARSKRFYETMTPGQNAALDEAIAEADRGDGVDRSALDARLNALFSHYLA